MVAIIINEFLKVTVKSSGAELVSLKNTLTNMEYLWQGDPAYWGRRAPVLFPIVGRLADNRCRAEGRECSLTQHGFARDMHFDLVDQKDQTLIYSLKTSEETLKLYPYKFELIIKYKLEKNKLVIIYEVINCDDQTIWFSIGAHPAFRCPLLAKENFTNYFLEFEEKEKASRYLLEDGLFTGETEPVLNNEKILNLSDDLFGKKDAIVFKGLKSTSVSLKSKKSSHRITMDFSGFPYFGIWTKGPFICLEPWYGLADEKGFVGELKDKEGILSLKPEERFFCEHSVAVG